MLGAVAAVIVTFGLLVWRSFKNGARRYAEMQESLDAERNPAAPE